MSGLAGKAANKTRGSKDYMPGNDYEVPTFGTDFSGGVCHGFMSAVAGTANIVNPDGATRVAVIVLVGWNPYRCKQIVSATGPTAADITVIY
jgi:hypothetical protein